MNDLPLTEQLVQLSLLPLVLLLSSCSNLSYYFQAIGGHAQIIQESQPITELLADAATPAELKQKLAAVSEIRQFASEGLNLPNNGSFKSYADLKRPFVVWNVFATPEF